MLLLSLFYVFRSRQIKRGEMKPSQTIYFPVRVIKKVYPNSMLRKAETTRIVSTIQWYLMMCNVARDACGFRQKGQYRRLQNHIIESNPSCKDLWMRLDGGYQNRGSGLLDGTIELFVHWFYLLLCEDVALMIFILNK